MEYTEDNLWGEKTKPDEKEGEEKKFKDIDEGKKFNLEDEDSDSSNQDLPKPDQY